MKYTQTWITPRGTAVSEAFYEPVHNTMAPPFSIAFFCPIRGDIWARRICTSADGKMTRFMCYTVPHPDEPHPYRQWWPAGTLLTFINDKALPSIPLPILIREFEIYYEWAQESLTTL